MTNPPDRYSASLLSAMAAIRGADLPDELARVADPSYLAQPLSRLLDHFQADKAAPVLDFGCGLAASSILLARSGFVDVLGVDVHAEWIEVARRRVAEEGLQEHVCLAAIGAEPPYDLPEGHFRTIVLNAVLEHVPPSLRGPILAELWRKLAPGGRLLLRETPNALWPIDSHFTGLPLVFYLPVNMRSAYARRCCRRCACDESLESLISRGLAPPSYFELRRALPAAEVLNRTLGGDVEFYFAEARGLRRALGAVFRLIEPVSRAVGVPVAAFFPYLALGFRKRPS
ncbi:class I SAM-dependent methyltransferase [bacterium]|nr:class I SAM-dependent methyltransferase [bacterium]